jgi:purine-binding chemotaxis protein CheW
VADSFASTTIQQQVLLVAAGEELFGIPMDCCLEILEPRAFARLPGAGAEVCGLINLRGRLVTVIDLGIWLARKPAVDTPGFSILVLDHGQRRVGLAVGQVVRIVTVESLPKHVGEGYPPPVRLDPVDLSGSGWTGAPVFTLLDPQAIYHPVLA